jgi:hypothetical protein
MKKQTFAEDSLVFETGGRARKIAESELDAWMEAHPTGLVVLPKQIADRKTGLMRLGEVSGFNYSLGNYVYLTVCATPRKVDAKPRMETEPAR